MKKFLFFVALGAAILSIPSMAQAEYVTAFEQHIDEKYVVDTSTIYQQDPNHINIGVYYTDNIANKTYPYTYKFWYNEERGQWFILEKKAASNNPLDIRFDEKHYWALVEPKSIAQDVLKIALAYQK